MNRLIQQFKKQGGLDLLKSYIRLGVLHTAIFQLLIGGKSKSNLETVRLTVQNKTQIKLKRKFSKHIEKYLTEDHTLNKFKNTKRIVWVCWLQGIENAPKLVKVCVESIQKMFGSESVVIITENNYQDYISLPEHIEEKWRDGRITNTHFSDILRASLLFENGGIWIDSTVLCTGVEIPKYLQKNSLFFYQILKPGKDGHAIFCSSWLISSEANNPIIGLTRELLFEYWKTENKLIDYFLFHHFLCIACGEYPELYEDIIKVDNGQEHVLSFELGSKFNQNKIDEILEQASIHKLTNKKDFNVDGSTYSVLMEKGNFDE